MQTSQRLSHLTGIGPYYTQKLQGLAIETVSDLIYHFPFRYDDFSNVSHAFEAKEGERVTLVGEVWSIKNIFTKTGKKMIQAMFHDGTTPITLTWFNQPWLINQLKTGDKIQISGKLSKFNNTYTIVSPVWEKAGNNVVVGGGRRMGDGAEISDNQLHSSTLHTGRLVPIYSETEGLTSKWLRTKIATLLPQFTHTIEDPLPDFIRGSMYPLSQALKSIHFPKTLEEVEKARERLGFDELFYIQLATIKARQEWKNKPVINRLPLENSEIDAFYEKLPFTLTDAQKRVVREIISDLQKDQPMNRLVQGEVGSGKTVVAAAIMFLVYNHGFRSLYMAPTEILAFQHYANITKLMEPFGISVGIYTGSKKFNKAQKKRRSIESGGKGNEATSDPQTPTIPDIIIGTHALLSDKLLPENIGLIVVDEQQRFGVEQRSILRSKAKLPHFLTMTATPIPRTVALTLYGDLDLSRIDQLPKGRQEIKTHVVPAKKRTDAYKFIENHIKNGEQAYIITPLIEQSETMQSAKAATVEFEKLSKKVFPKLKLGLLHGRLKPQEKEQVLLDFKDHKIDILVSTSVVEVGVDVPNATIMVIESAERFGLAQLHQLRGRVGRGSKQSYCFLFGENEDGQTTSRLKSMEKINDGLKLAELDLKIRGSGEIFGTKQSGRLELKIASFSDLPLIEKSRSAAQKVLSEDPNLDKYPVLKAKLASLGAGVMPD